MLYKSTVIVRRAVVLAAACASLIGIHALAENAPGFPNKPIHIFVANAAGGGTDFLARLVGQKMSERLGQPVVIENKPGANSMIAAQALIKSSPDGHTLLMGSIGMLTVNPAVVSNLSYDTKRDFAPISIIGSFPLILTVNAASPFRTVQDLVAYAKANPDKANTGASGPIFQVVQKMFELRTGTNFQYIAYRANSEAMIALMRGDILMSLSDTGPATGPLQDGRVRALAVTTSKRLPAYPDVPTMAEAGVKNGESALWVAMWGQAGMPADVVNKINADTRKALHDPGVKQKLQSLGNDTMDMSPEQFAKLVRSEMDDYAKVLKAAGVKPQ